MILGTETKLQLCWWISG